MSKMAALGADLVLDRYPLGGPDNLRAWDAADEHLFKQIVDDGHRLTQARVLVVNDSFGALSVALIQAGAAVTVWSDSQISLTALTANLKANGLTNKNLEIAPADQDPQGSFQLVFLKIPKNLAWWQDSLLRLRGVLDEGTQIMAGSMIKHTPRRAYDLLESSLGSTRTGLGWKKSRLAFSQFDPSLQVPERLQPSSVSIPEIGLTLHNQANVFSREKLDQGTAFLLQHLPSLTGVCSVLDLGCGNGVLALAVKRTYPEAQVTGIDESHLAVASARANAQSNDLEASFEVACDVKSLEAGSFDLVLCNPPFHQDRTVGDTAARQMFEDARGILKPGGELRIVGNRHLGYHARLTELFGGCALVAENDKFAILSARK